MTKLQATTSFLANKIGALVPVAKRPTFLPLLLVAAFFPFGLRADNSVPLSERSFRLIRGTESPDKRFALGFGLTTDRVKKGERRLIEDDPASEAALLDRGDPNLRNYLIDLRDQSILAETGATHFSADPHYNQNDCAAHWSPDSRTVVQVCTFKLRYTEACQLLRIDADGRRASRAYDLGTAAEERAVAFLKKRRNRAWRKGGEFAMKPLFLTVTNDTVAMTIWGEIVHSPERDTHWAVRVKMRLAMTSRFKVRGEIVSVRYPHEGEEIETRLSHHSPDKRYAMQTVYEAGHELWSSHFIHGIELVALPEKKVVAQLLPAGEVSSTFDFNSETPRLLWGPDSKWCAFHFTHPGRGGDTSGYTIVFREAGAKFVAANAPKQLRSNALDSKAEGRLNEDVAPVRWLKPGILVAKQWWQMVEDADSLAEISWELETAYDAKKGKMQVVRVKELSSEEAGKLDAEMRTPSAPE